MRIFYCYSKKLRNELLDNGFKYLHKGINEKTNNPFWAFEGSIEFNEFLENRRKRLSA